MRRSRFSEEQIIAILVGHEAGMKTQDVCRKYAISDATFYKWKAKFAGLTVYGIDGLQDGTIMKPGRGKPPAEEAFGRSVLELKRPAAWFAMMERVIADHGYSERRAYRLVGVDRSSFQYERCAESDLAVQPGCANWPISVDDLAIGVWPSC